MFGKKCPKCGKKLSKQKVWHAKSGTFEVETTCILCSSSEEHPNTIKKNQDNTTTIEYKTTDELEKEQSEREASRMEEKKIYEEFIKKEKERMEEEKKSKELVVILIKNGNSLYIEGKLEDAMDCYDKALEIDPDNIHAWKGKGDALSMGGKHEEATRYFNMILRINPCNIDALTAKADLLSKRGNHEQAINYFDRILEIEPNNAIALEGKKALKQIAIKDKQIFEDKSKEESQELRSKPLVVDKLSEPRGGIYGNCTKYGCDEKLHGLNSKSCKLCEQQVCLKHLQPEKHDCPKVIYTKYIRNTGWLMKRGQNVTTGVYTIVCDTCGYVSDFPTLIEQAGAELVSHLKNNEQCLKNKRTFLEELNTEPIQREKVRSSISIDPNRRFWVCAHCRPPRKFTDRDEYIAHHYTHS